MNPKEVEWVTLTIKHKKFTTTTKFVSKAWLEEFYVNQELSREELVAYGITTKLFTKSYHHWFSKEERRKIANSRISKAQRTKNSNRHNTGIPRIIIPEETLRGLVKQSFSLERMARELQVAPQTVRRNLEYCGIAGELISLGLPYEDMLAINAVSKLTGRENLIKDFRDLSKVQDVLDFLHEADQEVLTLSTSIRSLKRKLLHRAKSNSASFTERRNPGSRLNATFLRFFREENFDLECEFPIDNRHFDFKISATEILIEIDTTHYHSSPDQVIRDQEKTALAKERGYTLVRLQSDKDKSDPIHAKVKLCLHQLGLKKLPHAALKKCLMYRSALTIVT